MIAAITARLSRSTDVVVGSGDDGAAVAISSPALISTDLLVEGRHFRRDWCSGEDVGHRAAAQSLSDINAMGGRTAALTVGLCVPAELDLAWVVSLADGLEAEALAAGASVVGGDLTRGDQIVISVTALGSAQPPVTRGGANPGDLIAVQGRLGWAGAGLAILGRGFRSPRALVEAYRRPVIDYSAGPAAAQAGATSLIDISDGLVADLRHVAAASELTLDLATARFSVDEPLQAVGAALGVDPVTFILTGGDDHALVGTFAEGGVPHGWTVIGICSEGAPEVLVDGAPFDGAGGWRHF